MKSELIEMILNGEINVINKIGNYQKINYSRNSEVDNLFISIAKLSYNTGDLKKESIGLLVDEYAALKHYNDEIKNYIDGLTSGAIEIERINHMLITFVNQFCSKINQIDMTDRTRYNR